MNSSARVVNRSHQLSMGTADIWDIILRFGVINEEQHVGVEIEVRHLPSDQLVFLESQHHIPSGVLWERIDERLAQLRELLEHYIDPF